MTVVPAPAIVPGMTHDYFEREDGEMEPSTMPAVDVDYRRDEELLVKEWRNDQLRQLGIPWALAAEYAGLVDWHQVAELVARGCPPDLALEIVR